MCLRDQVSQNTGCRVLRGNKGLARGESLCLDELELKGDSSAPYTRIREEYEDNTFAFP